MKVAAIIQARVGSTRFPGKCFEKIGQYNSLEWLSFRLNNCNYLNQVILAVPEGQKKDFVDNIWSNWETVNQNIFEGDENNVIKRVIDAAEANDVDIIVDITADCPFVDPERIDTAILAIKNLENFVYCSNVYPYRTSIDGFDIQAYPYEILRSTLYYMSKNNVSNDHVGWNIPQFQGHQSLLLCHPALHIPKQLNIYDEWAVTLDEPDDLILLNKIYDHFKRYDMTEKEIMEYLIANQSILNINKDVKRKIPGE